MASIERRVTKAGVRYDIRYRSPSGRQLRKSFTRRVDAERFRASIHTDLARGDWIDPNLGKMTLREWVDQWRSTAVGTRPSAVARMRGALGEYVVAGIKTTVPFFTWLFAQPDFLAGRFHTTYLDDLLRARNGRSFVEVQPEIEDVAAIAAALHAVLSSETPASRGSAMAAAPALTERRWKARARAEGLN